MMMLFVFMKMQKNLLLRQLRMFFIPKSIIKVVLMMLYHSL